MDLLQEIKAEAKDEQLLQFLQRYGARLGSALVVLLMLFGGYLLWQERQEAKHAEEGQYYWEAAVKMRAAAPENDVISTTYLDKIANAFKEVSDRVVMPYQGLALLMMGNAAQGKEQYKEAVALFDQAQSTLKGHVLGELAALKAVQVLALHPVEQGQPLEARLTTLLRDTDSPWRLPTLLVQASWSYQQGRSGDALAALQEIRQRVVLLSSDTTETLAALEGYLITVKGE